MGGVEAEVQSPAVLRQDGRVTQWQSGRETERLRAALTDRTTPPSGPCRSPPQPRWISTLFCKIICPGSSVTLIPPARIASGSTWFWPCATAASK